MALQTATHTHEIPKSGKCDFIDQFYRLCDAAGNYKALPKKERLINATLRTPSTLADAEWIAKIYHEVYRGTYPYAEMVTPSWILEKFNDSNYIWGIFETDSEAPTPNEVCGCFTIVLDFHRKTAYFRGMMIRPKYQKLVALREMSFAMFWNTLHATHLKINKCYCESRTAHNITQYLASVVGCNCQAVLLNKDQFLNQYESDALMVGYTQDALFEDRIAPTEMHPDLIDLFDYFKDLNHLESVPMATYPIIATDANQIQELVDNAYILIAHEEFEYRKITVKIPNGTLTALFTPQIDGVEKIEWTASSNTEYIALVHVLQNLMTDLGVQYCEWYVPAEKIAAIEILLQFGYKPLGYVPAWERDENGRFHDCAVLSKHLELQDTQKKSMQLLEQGYQLLELITENKMNQDSNDNVSILISS